MPEEVTDVGRLEAADWLRRAASWWLVTQSGRVEGLSMTHSCCSVIPYRNCRCRKEVGDAVLGGAEPGDEVGFEGATDRGDFLDGFDYGGDEAGVVEGEDAAGSECCGVSDGHKFGKTFCTSWARKPRVVPCAGLIDVGVGDGV